MGGIENFKKGEKQGTSTQRSETDTREGTTTVKIVLFNGKRVEQTTLKRYMIKKLYSTI